MECTGLVYGTLRHLGIRLTNFCDGYFERNGSNVLMRAGPIPIGPRAWIPYQSGANKYPYEIKWINGQPIAKITDYQTDITYAEWIEQNNIAEGTVVVSQNPDDGFDHMWFYIGKYNDVNEIKKHLVDIGVSQDIVNTKLQFVVKNDNSPYWSIECNGSNGVCVTNRDPAVSLADKGGKGYVGFTLYDSSSYHLNIVKKDSNDSNDSATTMEDKYKNALGGAKYEIKQYLNASDTVNGYGYTDTDQGNNSVSVSKEKALARLKFSNNGSDSNGEITIKEYGQDKYDYYTIKEIAPPGGYKSDTNWEIGLRVYKGVYTDENGNNKVGISKIQFVKNGFNANGTIKDVNQNSSNTWFRIDKDGNVTNDSVNYKVGFEFNRNALTISWKNELITGKYDVKIKKVNLKNEPLSGVKFKVNNEVTPETDNDGLVTVATKTITTKDILNSDKYTISEVDLGKNNGLVKLKGSITIVVNKGLNADGNEYIASQAYFEDDANNIATNNLGTITKKAYLENNKEIYIQLAINNGVVIVTIPNQNTKKIKAKVVKKDNQGTILEGGEFEINAGGWEYTQIVANQKIDLQNLPYGEDFQQIYLKEVTPPTGHINVMGTNWVSARIRVDEDGNFELDNSKKIYSENKTNLIDESNDLYNYLENPKMEGDTLVFTIKNPPITGKYQLNIKKVDQNKKSISGVQFKINGTNSDPTDDNGEVVVATKTITNDNLNNEDSYTIEEVILPDNVDTDIKIIKLAQPITISVSKGLNAEKNKYIATSANFKLGDTAYNNGDSVKQTIILSDGTEKEAELSVQNGNVTLTIPNKRQKTVKVKVVKQDMDENEILGGEFEIELGQSNKGTIASGETLELGDFDLGSTLDGIFIKEKTPPTGYINKLEDVWGVAYTKITTDGNFEMIGNYNGNLYNSNRTYFIGKDDDRYNYYKNPEIKEEAKDTVVFTIKNPKKDGTYNFQITKNDISGKIIKDETTRFDVNVYSKKTEQNGNITLSDEVELKDSNGNIIETNDLEAITGITTKLNEIKIQRADLDKTYYFVVTETKAPDKFTEIDYKVVVPVTYSEESSGYIATKDTSFALINTNNTQTGISGTRKNLSEMSNNKNEIVTTSQTDVTINVKVPNKPKAGTFNFQLIKYIEGTKTPLANAKFKIEIYENKNNSKVYLNDENGNAINGSTEYLTGTNGYLIFGTDEEGNPKEELSGLQIDAADKEYHVHIVETSAPEGYIGAGEVEFTARSVETNDGYILSAENPVLENKKVKASIDAGLISVECYNTTKEGSFNFELIKYKAETTEPLKGAKFKIKIAEIINGQEVILKDKNGNAIDGKKEYETGSDGRLTTPITGLAIEGAGKTYTITLTETPPTGYIGIGTISFEATSRVEGNSYLLVSKEEQIQNKANINIDSNLINVKAYNTPKLGSFNFKLIKYKKGTEEKLNGAKFTIKIKNKQNNQTVLIYGNDGKTLDGTEEYVTKNGEISFDNLKIEKEGIAYEVTVTETQAPTGYMELSAPIIFEATSIWNDKTKQYELETKTINTIANTKKVDIKPGEILIEAENIPVPIIHKGVKNIKNQDSGYDANTEHDWVIQSTIPEQISDLKKYIITDIIDNRLIFSGIDKISVKILGDETYNDRTLTPGKDYLLSYIPAERKLKFSFVNENISASNLLRENAKLEIRFKTSFAKDDNGNIIALNKEVPNRATLTVNNGATRDIYKYSETPEVHTGGIKVLKYETINDKLVPLEGATFKIATSEANARNNKFIKVKDANGNDTTNDLVGTSDVNGIVEFTGLEFGGDANANESNKKTHSETKAEVYDYDFNTASSRFWIVETEAPKGYIKYTEPVEVIITKDSYNTEITKIPSVENTRIEGKYSINLKKVRKTNNSPIGNAKFGISSTIRNAQRTGTTNVTNGVLSVTNGEVFIVKDGETELQNNQTSLSKTDIYTITEMDVDDYLKLKNPIKLSVYKNENNSAYNVSKIVVSEVNTTNKQELIVSDSNKSVTLKGVKLADNIKTVDIVVAIDNSNNISVTIPNDDLEGNYNFVLIKRYTNIEKNAVIGNIPFKINDNENIKYTDQTTGKINVSEEKEVNGAVKITKDNVNVNDVYKIEELENEDTKNISILENPITITVFKGINADKTAYVIKKVGINYTSVEGNMYKELNVDFASNSNNLLFNVKTKNGKDTVCILGFDTKGILTLTVKNPSKEGGYKLQLNKVVEKNDGTTVNKQGVSFNITDKNETNDSKSIVYPKTTDSSGNTEIIYKAITKETLDTTDKFIISEVSSGDDKVIKLKNNLILEVKKKISGNKYVIDKVKLTEEGTNKTTNEVIVDEQNGANVQLNGVTLIDGRTVNIGLVVNADNLITVKIKNKEMIGKYSVQIKKVDSVTGNTMSGVTFKGTYRNNEEFTKTTNAQGIAVIATNEPINNIIRATYEINEISLPSDLIGKYVVLTDYVISARVSTKMNDSKTAYVIDNVELSSRCTKTTDNYSDDHARQEELVKNITYEISGDRTTVTVVIGNEPKQNYSFNVKKVDMENNPIKDAKFTIKENGKTILDNAKLGDLGEYLVNRQNQTINTKYKYEIYETEAAPGYDNILNKMYIELLINIDENGVVSAKSEWKVDYSKNGSVTDKMKTMAILSQYTKNTGNKLFVDNGNNSYTVNIPNPRSAIPMNFTLNKHETNSEQGVTGAVFGVRRYFVEKETNNINLNGIIDKFASGTDVETLSDITTNANNKNLSIDSVESVKLGDTYYYEVSENTVPANYNSTYQKVIVRIHTNVDRTITGSIIAIMPKDSDSYVPYVNNTHSSVISLNTENTNVKLNWANNKIPCTVKLYKKQFKKDIPKDANGNVMWSGLEGLPGATFTVKQVSPVEEIIYDEQILSDFQFFNNLANSNTTYHYEIIEHSSREGYTNIFEGCVVHLYITTDEIGLINDAPNATYFEIKDQNGNDISNSKKKYLGDKIGLQVNDDKNVIDFYILNEEKTLKIALLKVTDKVDGKDNLIGIPGIEFGILGPDLLPIRDENGNNLVTDENGYIYIDNVELTNGIQNYVIREENVPTGVTKLEDTEILLRVDTSGLTSPEQITADRITVTLNPTSSVGVTELEGLSTSVEGSTVVLKIPNPTEVYAFRMYKTDELGTLLHTVDGEGAPNFIVSKLNENGKYEVVHRGALKNVFVESGICEPDTTYQYKVEEVTPKLGYINILQGYELYVEIQTDANARVKGEGYTTFRLEKKANAEQLYTEEELIKGGYINLTIEKDLIDLYIVNPYGYQVTINKKSKNGEIGVDKATIAAERIDNVRAYDLAIAERDHNNDAIETILKEIVDSNEKSKEVKLGKQTTVTSEILTIGNNGSMMPLDDTAQTWRIKETDVQAPYINVLGDNYIIAQTIYREGELRLVSHQELVNETVETINYYVCNRNGENITNQYLDKIDVITEKINGIWNLSVTVKDPAKFYVDMTKIEYNPNAEDVSDYVPLSGAELTITSSKSGNADITNGESKSERIVTEMAPGEVVTFTIQESKSAIGHKNVLENKIVNAMIRMDEKGNVSVVGTVVVDTAAGKQLYGAEKEQILKYIKFEPGTAEDGYPIINVYVENPVEYKFKLKKQDTAGNGLLNTEIEVVSSHSGTHYLNGLSQMEFTEENLKPGSIIQYRIRENRTVENSAYVNVFDKTMYVIVRVDADGTLKEVMSYYSRPSINGSSEQVPIKTLDFLEYGITNPDSQGIQTMYFTLENPTQIDIELLKKQAGEDGASIANTDFTILSSFSDKHSEVTNSSGKIYFRESKISEGEYTFKIKENRPADANYANILQNKYMQVSVWVKANGEITEPKVSFYRSNYEDDFNNNNRITKENAPELYARLEKYTSVEIDKTNPINKLIIKIENPITMQFDIHKEQTDGTSIENVEFEINSELSGIAEKTTNNNGDIVLDNDKWVDPGIYKYEITEKNTAGNQYDNILEGHKIITYVKVSNEGLLSLVADKSGTEFASNEQYKYYIEKIDGSTVDSNVIDNIHKYIKLQVDNYNSEKNHVRLDVINPVRYTMNIVKKNSANNQISGTKFTVVRDNIKTLLDNSEVSARTEIEERNMSEGFYTFNITEDDTVPNSAYVNILEGKFVKVYTELKANGVLKIKDDEANTSRDYFEIYEGDIYNSKNAKLLDKTEYSKLYDLVSVRSHDDDGNGIYELELTVINPVNIDVEILKKQVGTNGKGIPNTKFTVKRDENNKHEDIYTDGDGKYNFTEKSILPGNYTYRVEELETATYKYINILENKYMEVYINVSESGVITYNGYEIFDKITNASVDALTKNKISNYININVDDSMPTQKLVITIYNPVTMNFNVIKKDIENKNINGANFTINRTLVKAETEFADFTTKTLNENTVDGKIKMNVEFLKPGIYKYEITENNTAGLQYTNILENCKIVVFVKLDLNGDVIIVADENGRKLGINEYKYKIESTNNSVVDVKHEEIIHKYISVGEKPVNKSSDEVECKIINPAEFRLDIIKVDDKNKNFEGAKFTVIRDTTKVIDNKDITSEVELTEQYLEAGEHVYYLTEDSTQDGYINILKGKFVKVYTSLSGNGELKIKNQYGNNSDKYFEIYEGSLDNIDNAIKLSKEDDEKLFNNIEVESIQVNGVYRLNVKVKNPERIVNIALNKKIYGEEKIDLYNTYFAIKSSFSGDYKKFTNNKGNISITEKGIPAGVYEYFITEKSSSGKQFVNVLNNTYIKVIIKVNEDGTIEIVNEDGNVEENKYYVYKQKDNSEELEKIDFDNTVYDEFIKVNTSVINDISQLDIHIKNPEYYNFELVKIDKDTKEHMNGVEFELTVFDEQGNIVQLKDAETLKPLSYNSLITENINGVDGVIVIPKILIEKAGKYKFNFNEKSTDGIFKYLYKTHKNDINVEIEVVVKDGEYIIKSPSITKGNEYVESFDVTTSKSQYVKTEVTNERIKGSYSLSIDKLDSYTDRCLKDAEFEITVEKDGQPYEIYESNDNVESKNIMIPNRYEINENFVLSNLRIERPETYTIILTETKAPKGYMLLDKPIKIEVTTTRYGEFDEEEFILESVKLIDGDNYGLVTVRNDDKNIIVTAKNEYFDLALRKSIDSVSYADKDDSKITQDETKDRVPEVITTDIIENEEVTTAKYNHIKNHVRAYASQEVIYTLRVYNEGEIDGYAEEITDHLPEGLEFVDDNFNKERGWKLDPEDPTLKTVKTTYLSKENNPDNDEFNAEKNLIKAMDKVTGELDYKEIQIKCRISDDVKAKTVLTNIAEISLSKANNRTSKTIDRDSVTNNVEVPKTPEEMSNYQENNLTDDRNTYIPGQEDDDDFEKLIVEEFDLALRKYIVAVNNQELLANNTKDEIVNNTEDNKEDSKDKNTTSNVIKYERQPRVNVSALKDKSSTTATYTHTKEPVEVSVGDIVTYTLEVFNEGTVSGYASLIKDDIPEGLEFVTYKEGDGSTNDIYRWKMVDENDNEVTDPTKAKYVISDYLSKANEVSENGNLINAYDPSTMSTLDSKHVKVAFRVICKKDHPDIIENQAQISEDSDESGKSVTDRDSTPNEWKGEDDEDIEKIKVHCFDLALRKWVTKAIVIQDGKTNVTETGHHAEDDPEEVVKVDLKKSKINSVVVKFEYQIRITNEGEIAGYAKEIKDYIPEGLVFDAADNPSWVQVEDRIITTDQLKYKLLQPGESAEVTVVLRWVNSATNMGVKVNIAEISKDYNEYETPDIDSTPNNFVEGEDDIDDAPVMLTIKTGSQSLRYIIISLGVLAILGLGVGLIRDEFKRKR
ncbi:MAG: SpaH/EbpB family LPXTG-anchored major pilin [Clostridia bacterium]|nr:SpaH/EbpB family LPXTG-anchored major pilin [Clostridia bacterium]